MKRCIIGGSPRINGRSAQLADALFEACMEDCPEDEVSILSVASLDIKPCIACDVCKHKESEGITLPEEGDPLYPCEVVTESTAGYHRCCFDDDMAIVRKHIDAADELIVVSPVFFSSVPAQLKALLDRLQPYFWSNLRKKSARPLVVHVVGEGGDPFGFDPLLGALQSAFYVAGFKMDQVLDWVGCIDKEGEILEDARPYTFSACKSKGHQGRTRKLQFDRQS